MGCGDWLYLWLWVKRKGKWEERERRILFIILLDSLYYFTKSYVNIKLRRRMNCKMS